MTATATKPTRPTDAELVALLRRVAAWLGGTASELIQTDNLAKRRRRERVAEECGENCRIVEDVMNALAAASAEPFEAKVERAAEAMWDDESSPLPDDCWQEAGPHHWATYRKRARIALRAAGLEG